MNYLFLLLFLCGCATYTPPNLDLCVPDAPKHDHCTYIIQGDDFSVDEQHPYVLHGENETYDTFEQDSIRISVGAYVILKESFLNWCNASPKSCTYQTVTDHIDRFEEHSGLKEKIENYKATQQ